LTTDNTIGPRGGWYAEFQTPASVPPIWQSTAFDVDGLPQLDQLAAGEVSGYTYTRDGNPNHAALAADISALEGAESSVVCGSGMGAIAAALLAHVRPGDHVIAGRSLYGRTLQLVEHLQASNGVEISFVDTTQPDAVFAATRPKTRLCLLELISNPLLEIADLAAIAAGLDAVPVFVDSTFATPILARPLELGAELVLHSASKYLNGHGDVTLGTVSGSAARIAPIADIVSLFGMPANPFECWLTSRGLRTLELRIQRMSQTALKLAEFLESHRAIQRVYYPGLEQHPGHMLAHQMFGDSFGGMLSFELHGGRSAVSRLFDALSDIPFSPTLGDARTSVSYPAGTSHKSLSSEQRQQSGITDGLVRLSTGLESCDRLCRELDAGLNEASAAAHF
jgi:cystathionine beta-lyase/cystathionine gamma-synthase